MLSRFAQALHEFVQDLHPFGQICMEFHRRAGILWICSDLHMISKGLQRIFIGFSQDFNGFRGICIGSYRIPLDLYRIALNLRVEILPGVVLGPHLAKKNEEPWHPQAVLGIVLEYRNGH